MFKKLVGIPTIMILLVSVTSEAELLTRSESLFLARNLRLGNRGEDVRELQKFLNQSGYTVSTIGPGSPGQETTYFGKKTQRALVQYQIGNEIAPAIGHLGPITREHIKRGLPKEKMFICGFLADFVHGIPKCPSCSAEMKQDDDKGSYIMASPLARMSSPPQAYFYHGKWSCCNPKCMHQEHPCLLLHGYGIEIATDTDIIPLSISAED